MGGQLVGPRRVPRYFFRALEVAALCVSLFAPTSSAMAAETVVIPFGGRLVGDGGSPLEGAVDLEATIWGSLLGEDLISKVPLVFKQVPLVAGLFAVTLTLDAEEQKTAEANGRGGIFIEIRDLTNGRSYRRQRLDWQSLHQRGLEQTTGQKIVGEEAVAPRLDPVPTSESGLLSPAVAPVVVAACLASAVAGAKFVADDFNVGSLSCASRCTQARAGSACLRGWTVYRDDAFFEYGTECTTGGTAALGAPLGRVCCCLSTRGAAHPFRRASQSPSGAL